MNLEGRRIAVHTPSPGLRLQYYTESDNQTGTVNLMTNLGLRLFDAAIEYALATDPKP